MSRLFVILEMLKVELGVSKQMICCRLLPNVTVIAVIMTIRSLLKIDLSGIT